MLVLASTSSLRGLVEICHTSSFLLDLQVMNLPQQYLMISPELLLSFFVNKLSEINHGILNRIINADYYNYTIFQIPPYWINRLKVIDNVL